jgi:hypothetical protein
MSIKILKHASDCPKWEVLESDVKLSVSAEGDLETATEDSDVEPSGVFHYLRCVTTGKHYPIHIAVPSHDHLDWVAEV